MDEVVKKKKSIFKKWWFYLGVIIIIIIASNQGGKKDNPTIAAPSATSTDNSKVATTTATVAPIKTDAPKKTDPPKTTFKLNEEAPSGKISYNVSEVKVTDTIGTDMLQQKTENQYVVLKIKVTNNDKDSRTIDTNLFKLKDTKGKEYSADAMADMYANTNGTTFFLAQINPELTKTGYIVFETPKGIKGLTLECSSGLGFSGGKFVTIDLGQ